MKRRGFLRAAALAMSAVGVKLIYGWFGSSRTDSRSFHVAGVRFQTPVGGLRSGDPVRISLGYFRDEPCYAVLSQNGEKIGYAPHSEVSMLRSRRILRSWLSMVQENAVPWKRYVVTVLMDDWNVRK